jgi:RNA polymerase sigma-70 factor, ECF subfamily
MSSESSFDGLLTRLRRGDGDAASQLFARYANRVIALARSRMDKQIRQKVDPEDVLQSVFKSFFARYKGGNFELKDWDSLWGLLVVVTLRKCSRKARYFHGAVHDVRKEAGSQPDPDESDLEWDFEAKGPTPADEAVLEETLDHVMDQLKDRDRQILELRLQGYTIPEISEKIGRTEYTVSGALKRIRKQLKGMEQDG